MTEEQKNTQFYYGEIIYHPDYGFGIMKEKPCFKNVLVLGVQKQCVRADDLLDNTYRYHQNLIAKIDELQEIIHHLDPTFKK